MNDTSRFALTIHSPADLIIPSVWWRPWCWKRLWWYPMRKDEKWWVPWIINGFVSNLSRFRLLSQPPIRNMFCESNMGPTAAMRLFLWICNPFCIHYISFENCSCCAFCIMKGSVSWNVVVSYDTEMLLLRTILFKRAKEFTNLFQQENICIRLETNRLCVWFTVETQVVKFSQFSGCWLILSVYILMSFDFPFGRLFGVR